MEDGIFFNQSKYIKEMLKKFGLEDSKPTKTPMSTKIKLTKDDEADSVDSSKYRGMIGSLLYLTASRPDIMFSVCLCARFQENPKTTHLEAVKRIFRYIRGTSHLGLWYPKGTGIETIVYADSDHAGDYVDRKSTSGVCTFMGCCLTSWFAKKQTALAISTTEAEYVSAGKACQQALWMKQALIDYGIRLDDVPIMCDNKGAIDLSKNPVQHSRTKHIEIRNGFINEEVYVAQPPRFNDFQKPNYVYKHKKALYGLKQAPKAWYDRLKAFLIKYEYSMGMVDNTLFTKKSKSHLIIVQIYIDDIIFGSTSQNLCDDFAKIMHDEFEMSMMGELNFFLGLQIKQMEDGIFFNQSNYNKEMLKKFGLEDSKPTKTLMSTEIKLTKDDEADSVDSSKYRGMIGS
ncbi:retrovirus-related pol polyprotein from transposon TNT 1-94 [Tanacetum coccineum]